MADGVFTIEADIDAVFDQRAAEQTADKLAAIINDRLSKQIGSKKLGLGALDTKASVGQVDSLTKALETNTRELKDTEKQAALLGSSFTKLNLNIKNLTDNYKSGNKATKDFGNKVSDVSKKVASDFIKIGGTVLLASNVIGDLPLITQVAGSSMGTLGTAGLSVFHALGAAATDFGSVVIGNATKVSGFAGSLGKIGAQVAPLLVKSLATAATTLIKFASTASTFALSNPFGIAAVGLASLIVKAKGFDGVIDGFKRAGQAINSAGSAMLRASGNSGTLLTTQQKLNRAFSDVKNSTGALRDLPKTFSDLQTSVIAGTSSLQKSAKAGDSFSRSLLPFLGIATAVARDVDAIGFSLRSTDKLLTQIRNSIVPFSERVPSSFRKSLEAVQEFDKRSNLTKFKEMMAGVKQDLADFKAAPPAAPDAFLASVFGREPVILTGIARIKASIKNAFSGRGSIVEPTQLHLFDTGAVVKEAESTARIAAATLGTTITAKIKDNSGGSLKLFDVEQLQAQAGKAGKVVSQALAGSGKTQGFVEQLIPEAKIKAQGETVAKGFLAALKAKFRDESGQTTAGFGGSVISSGFSFLGKSASTALAPVKALAGAIGGVGKAAGPQGAILAGVAAFIGLGVAALSAAADMERIQTSLSGIFRDGPGALKVIQDFANVTPFRLQTAADAVVQLSSSFENLQPKQAVSVLTEIAGAAAAVGAGDAEIQRVIVGLTQIQSNGKLAAADVRQVTQALPSISKTNIIKNLATDLHLSQQAAADLLNNGLVPSEAGLKSILETMHQVPGATSALAKQSQTFQGLLSTTKDELQQFLAVVGTPILRIAAGALKAINLALQDMIFAAHAVAAPLTDAIHWLERLPIVGGAVSSLTAAVKSNGDAWQGAESDIQGALTALDSVGRAAQNLANSPLFDIPNNLSALFGAVNDKADQFNSTQKDLFTKVLQSKSAFEAQASALENVKQAQQAYTIAITDHNKQVADDTLRLNKQLLDANQQLADSDQRLADAQTALADARKAADPEDVEKGDLALVAAKLKLRQLLEDEKKATDALNASQSTNVDLTGLTLDQIRARLNNVRESLKAQQSNTTAKSDAKTAEQQNIDALQAGVDRRNAELEVKDAEQAVLDLKVKGSELDTTVIAARKEVASAEKDRGKSLEAQQATQTEINKLSETDLNFERQKEGLQKSITEAKRAQRDADQAAALAVLEARGDQQGILDLLFSQINTSPQLLGILNSAAMTDDQRLDINRRLGIQIDQNTAKLSAQDALSKTLVDNVTNPSLQGSFISGGLFPQSAVTPPEGTDAPALLNQAANLLHQVATGQSVKDTVLRTVARTLHIPGFKRGGVAQFGTESLVRLHGMEAVLPLSNPASLRTVLANQSVLHPVLNALARITLPTGGQGTGSPLASFSPGSGRAGNQKTLDRHATEKQNRELARFIAEELIAAGVKGVDIHNTFHVDQTAPNTQLSERAMTRVAEKAVEKAMRPW